MTKNLLKSFAALIMFSSALSGCSGTNSTADTSQASDSTIKIREKKTDEGSDSIVKSEPAEQKTEPETDLPSADTQQEPAELPVEVVDVQSLPDTLTSFLQSVTFLRGDRYDSEHVSENGINLFENICIFANCFDFSLYPSLAQPEFHYGEMDPRGWSTSIQGYAIYDGPTVEWVATNLFNVPSEELESEILQAEQEQKIYRQDQPDGSYKYYVINVGGGGGAFPAVRLLSAQKQGTSYVITFDMVYKTPDQLVVANGPHYVEVEEKTIDGNTYWSLYRFQRNSESWNQ